MKYLILSEEELSVRDKAAMRYAVEAYRLKLEDGLTPDYVKAAFAFQDLRDWARQRVLPGWATHVADIRTAAEDSFSRVKLLQYCRIDKLGVIANLEENSSEKAADN